MDSTGERNPAGANNRERGESAIESGITALMSRREEEHVMSMQQRHRDDDESDEVIDVGSDSEEDGGVRDEKSSTTLDAMASFLPYSGHGACGEKVNDRSVEMQEREAAATLVDPSVAAQGSTEVGSGEDRQSTVTALRAHFRDEEEEEEGDVEEGVTKTYVRNKVSTWADARHDNPSLWSCTVCSMYRRCPNRMLFNEIRKRYSCIIEMR